MSERADAESLQMSKIKVWWLAIRPKTLWAAVVPVVVGSAIAVEDAMFHLPAAVMALIGSVAIQVGTNLFNDYADFVRGSDRSDRKGPTRVTQAGLLSPKTVLVGTVVAFGVALTAGSYLIWRAGIPILALGVLSIVSGILYTAGPKPLGYIGLGDLFVLIFFGPVAVAGTHFVQSLSLSWEAVAVGLGPGLLSVALLAVNNLRDIDEDRLSGKRTLAVRFGARFARGEYVICVTAAALLPALIFAFTGAHPWSILAGGILIGAVPIFRQLRRGLAGAELNPLLGLTGRLSLMYSLVFALTWLL